ncbi:unnamed protein product [Effrenium voratum]|uniref:Uncharacterized protein n=1 Tax=Effrenium voratum TaxID=2562239 RepID=A0AA36ITK0_9DINO|nr:unnamed protein product [Effrenium voratum]
MASRKRACSLAVLLTFLSVRLCFLPPNVAKPIERRIAPRRQAAAVLLLGAAPAEAMPSLAETGTQKSFGSGCSVPSIPLMDNLAIG